MRAPPCSRTRAPAAGREMATAPSPPAQTAPPPCRRRLLPGPSGICVPLVAYPPPNVTIIVALSANGQRHGVARQCTELSSTRRIFDNKNSPCTRYLCPGLGPPHGAVLQA